MYCWYSVTNQANCGISQVNFGMDLIKYGIRNATSKLKKILIANNEIVKVKFGISETNF